MKFASTLSIAVAAMTLVACQREPAAVVTPAPATAPAVVVVPGPPGPAGATGATGTTGDTGATGQRGKTGDNIVVVPAR